MQAFEEAVRATASKHAPWFVVPADNKWFTRLVVMGAIVKALDGLDLAYPQIDRQKEKELDGRAGSPCQAKITGFMRALKKPRLPNVSN